MSALGDRLRRMSDQIRHQHGGNVVGHGQATAYVGAAVLADEHEAKSLAETRQGRGPHAALALRWLQDEFMSVVASGGFGVCEQDPCPACSFGDWLQMKLSEAER